MSLADFIAARTVRTPRAGDIVPLGAIALVVQRVTKGRVASVGLRLAEELEPETLPATMWQRLKRAVRRLWSRGRVATAQRVAEIGHGVDLDQTIGAHGVEIHGEAGGHPRTLRAAGGTARYRRRGTPRGRRRRSDRSSSSRYRPWCRRRPRRSTAAAGCTARSARAGRRRTASGWRRRPRPGRR